MRSYRSLFGIIVPALTIAIFAVFLVFSLMRLSTIDRSMRIEVTQNMLWVISRAQASSHTLQEAVTLRTLGLREQEDVDRSLDIFLGHFNVLNDGPQRRVMTRLRHSSVMDRVDRERETLAALTVGIAVGETEKIASVHAILAPYNAMLVRAANMAMVDEWEGLGSKLDNFRREIAAIILSLVVISIAGAGMTLHLTQAIRSARLRDRLLERERAATDIYRNFAAMISHQFRTPLAIVDSALQRLVRRADKIAPDELVERSSKARHAISRLVHLVESTLEAARLDAGHIAQRTASRPLGQIAQEALRRQQEDTPDRHFVFDALSPAIARCDPVHSEHIIVNLLSNAAKYAPADTAIRIAVGQSKQQAWCSVTNAGHIAPQDHAHLFERYFRASHVKEKSGAGIGLYMARSLARLQDGDVIFNEIGADRLAFTLILPLADTRA